MEAGSWKLEEAEGTDSRQDAKAQDSPQRHRGTEAGEGEGGRVKPVTVLVTLGKERWLECPHCGVRALVVFTGPAEVKEAWRKFDLEHRRCVV